MTSTNVKLRNQKNYKDLTDLTDYKDLTETGNRARKVSGTQGIFKKIYI